MDIWNTFPNLQNASPVEMLHHARFCLQVMNANIQKSMQAHIQILSTQTHAVFTPATSLYDFRRKQIR